jgi:hypothetical protein
MRVSLQIDGDSSGAVKAAQDTSSSIDDIRKKAESVGSAAAAANDNIASSIAAVTQKVVDLASKTGAAHASFVKVAAGAASVAEGIGSISKAAGALPALTGAIGVAATAASVLYDVVNKGSKSAEEQLNDQVRLIGMIRDAYSKAKGSAEDFYQYGADATKVLLLANEAALRKQLQTQVGQYLSGATTYKNVGDFFAQETVVKTSLRPFEDALIKLNQEFKGGTPDVEAYIREISKIALLKPELVQAAAAEINKLSAAAATAKGLSQDRSGINIVSGKGTAKDERAIGINPDQNAAAFDRYTNATTRQIKALEAEAQSAGKSAGEAARLRTQLVLNEAALQAGSGTAEKHADKIAALADRYGEAAQKAALAKLQSDAFFDRAQLGRTADEAAVAVQLRGAFGDNANPNSGIANMIRANNEMRELKTTTQDLASGAISDLRQQVQALGVTWQATGNVALHVVDRLIEKLASKQLDSLISNIFGSLLGGSSIGVGAAQSTSTTGLSLTSTGGLFDKGGYTGAGGKYQVAGIVHRDEFVFDQDATRRIGPANLERLRRGVPGYAGGGLVGGNAPYGARPAAAPQGGGGSLPVKIEQTFNLVGAMGKEDISRMIASANQQSAQQILKIVDDQAPARERQRQLLGN